MKTVVIGDTHCHTSWKKVLEQNQDADKVIFLGDYYDTFDTALRAKADDNFNEILDLKRKEPDKYVILLGNHDYHYLLNSSDERYSGFSNDSCYSANKILRKAVEEDLLQVLYIQDKIIFSHAGVSKCWLNEVAGLKNLDEVTIDKMLNYPYALSFNFIKGYSPYGDTISQSPIWIRPNSLIKDKLDGFDQIVGHTPSKCPICCNFDDANKIWIVDTMPNYYLQIIDNKVIPMDLATGLEVHSKDKVTTIYITNKKD